MTADEEGTRVQGNSARIATMLQRAVIARAEEQRMEDQRQNHRILLHAYIFHTAPYCTCVGACVCRFATINKEG
jgi:hypothetical protein